MTCEAVSSSGVKKQAQRVSIFTHILASVLCHAHSPACSLVLPSSRLLFSIKRETACSPLTIVYTQCLFAIYHQISGLISKLKDTLTAKEQELTTFKDKHNIHVKGDKESPPEDNVQTSDKTTGILVAQDSS